MRNQNRLYHFYNELMQIHMNHPDIRFGQLINNFTRWLAREKDRDIFYLEEDDFLKLFKEYMKED